MRCMTADVPTFSIFCSYFAVLQYFRSPDRNQKIALTIWYMIQRDDPKEIQSFSNHRNGTKVLSGKKYLISLSQLTIKV